MIHFGLREHQRRREGENIAHRHFEVQAAFKRAIHHPLGLVGGRFAFADEFDAQQQTLPPHVADQAVAGFHFAQLRQRVVAKPGGMFHQLFVADHVQRRQAGGAADGILLVRVVAERGMRGHIERFTRQQGRDRKYATAQPLAQHQHVRHDVVMLAREHAPGATEADGNLVEDQQRAVLVAGGPDAFPIIRRRDERRAAHRLADDGGHVALLFQDIVNVVGTGEVAGGATFEGTAQRLGRRDMFATRQQRPDALAEHGFTAHRDRIQRGAVEGIPHRNKFEPAGGDARELEGHADGRGAARREQHAIQIARRDFPESFGQFDRRRTRVTAGAKAEFVKLLLDGRDDAGMREADLMHVVPVEVEITPAFDILNPRALRLRQHVEARRGEGLMQEVSPVGFEQRLRRRRNVFRGPGAAPGREVHIAFRAEVIEIVAGRRNGR